MTDTPETNAPESTETGGSEPGKRGRWGAAGLGAAIGSAAIVAALLYANRNKGKDKKKS